METLEPWSGVVECKEHAVWGQMMAVRIQTSIVSNHLISLSLSLLHSLPPRLQRKPHGLILCSCLAQCLSHNRSLKDYSSSAPRSGLLLVSVSSRKVTSHGSEKRNQKSSWGKSEYYDLFNQKNICHCLGVFCY